MNGETLKKLKQNLKKKTIYANLTPRSLSKQDFSKSSKHVNTDLIKHLLASQNFENLAIPSRYGII